MSQLLEKIKTASEVIRDVCDRLANVALHLEYLHGQSTAVCELKDSVAELSPFAVLLPAAYSQEQEEIIRGHRERIGEVLDKLLNPKKEPE